MEFGVLFTSHPKPTEEPHPHRDVHARTSEEVIERAIPAFHPPVRRAVAAE